MRLAALAFFFLFMHNTNAQIFQNAFLENEIELFFENVVYGAGISMYDLNNDGLDDITIPGNDGEILVYFSSADSLYPVEMFSSDADLKSLIWVDYDNDGDPDLSFSELDGYVRLFENDGNFSFSEIPLDFESNFPTYNSGISWGDYDNDGFLDLYVCRYEVDLTALENYNLLYKNNGDGTFSDVTLSSGVDDGIQPSFMAVWIDLNQDGYQDIYVINDRSVNSNSFLENNGDGTFTNNSSAYGLDIIMDSMSNSFVDSDNDGDFDFFSTNTAFGGNILFENNDDYYSSVTDSGLEINLLSWGAKWVDLDNNMWKEVLVTVDDFDGNAYPHLFNNEGGNFFTENLDFPVMAGNSFASAKGDINDDGLYDLAVLFSDTTSHVLLQNRTSTANNWVKILLKGTVSNADGIGSRITVFSGGSSYLEYTFCGSDYLSQDSQYKILGLGENEVCDSLKIDWPSGLEETYYNLYSGSKYTLTEGTMLSPQLSHSGSLNLCEGDSIVVTHNAFPETPIWSNGHSTSSITITDSGTYYLSYLMNGQWIYSDTIEVTFNPFPEILQSNITHVSCFGEADGSIELIYTDYNTEEITLEFGELTEGNYNVELTSELGCSTFTSVDITEPSLLFSVITNSDNSCFGDSLGEIYFQSQGGTPPYLEFLDDYETTYNLPSGFYTAHVQDENGCIFSQEIEISEPIPPQVNIITENAIGNELGSIIIETDNFDIDNVSINDENGSLENYNLAPGYYEIILTDTEGCQLTLSTEVNAIQSINEFNSNIRIAPNPFSDHLIITSSMNEVFSYDLKSLQGESLSTEIINSSNFRIDLEKLTSGCYFLVLTGSFGEKQFKIIKN